MFEAAETHRKRALPALVAVLLCALLGSTFAQPAGQGVIESYSAVTDERLADPEASNWLMYRGTYDGMGYSELDQINSENVAQLVPVWTMSTGVTDGHESPP